LIHDGNLKFNNHFKCKTVHRPSEALALVERDGT
jgi:hypothetical protein